MNDPLADTIKKARLLALAAREAAEQGDHEQAEKYRLAMDALYEKMERSLDPLYTKAERAQHPELQEATR